MLRRIWPRNMQGQMLLAVALALLLAQTVSAVLIYRSQHERREAGQVHAAAFRLLREARGGTADGTMPGRLGGRRGGFWIDRSAVSPIGAAEWRDRRAERELHRILEEQDVMVDEVAVVRRAIGADRLTLERLERREGLLRPPPPDRPDAVMLAAMHQPSGGWVTARVLVPPGERMLLATLIGQTLLIYCVLVGVLALLLRRITRPLANLTNRMERFATTRDADGQIAEEGPEDLRRLIAAHNAMEDRIVALIAEKDVMLGAIGHDLKTPLAALRVRIESVENDTERRRMAGTIEDITHSLDDILSLARAGHAREPLEPVELSALVASVVEEFEDMAEPVTLADPPRLVVPLRATWIRRALRNLIGNALRYGHRAEVSLCQSGSFAEISVGDEGPGIPEADIPRMLEPFTRGEPSRNTDTGGAGLGLALARAIAEQHGGELKLANRQDGEGLVATLCLPLTR